MTCHDMKWYDMIWEQKLTGVFFWKDIWLSSSSKCVQSFKTAISTIGPKVVVFMQIRGNFEILKLL